MFNTYLDINDPNGIIYLEQKSLQLAASFLQKKRHNFWHVKSFISFSTLLLTIAYPEEQNTLTLIPRFPLKNIIPYNLLTLYS